jgi:hypothetical protein
MPADVSLTFTQPPPLPGVAYNSAEAAAPSPPALLPLLLLLVPALGLAQHCAVCLAHFHACSHPQLMSAHIKIALPIEEWGCQPLLTACPTAAAAGARVSTALCSVFDTLSQELPCAIDVSSPQGCLAH